MLREEWIHSGGFCAARQRINRSVAFLNGDDFLRADLRQNFSKPPNPALVGRIEG